jgi:hypothetical protein
MEKKISKDTSANMMQTTSTHCPTPQHLPMQHQPLGFQKMLVMTMIVLVVGSNE